MHLRRPPEPARKRRGRHGVARGRSSEAGQASVELVALLPLMAVLAALAWQVAVAGQAVWLAGTAARAAARAHALGSDALSGARASLPVGYRHRVQVRALSDGRVAVRLAVPVVVVGGGGLGSVARTARFAPQNGLQKDAAVTEPPRGNRRHPIPRPIQPGLIAVSRGAGHPRSGPLTTASHSESRSQGQP